LPRLTGEVARDAGRFSPARHDDATALIDAIHDSRRTAMIQPYLARVDELGETTIIYIGGEPRTRSASSPSSAPTPRRNAARIQQLDSAR
jgi:hypothetical protein